LTVYSVRKKDMRGFLLEAVGTAEREKTLKGKTP